MSASATNPDDAGLEVTADTELFSVDLSRAARRTLERDVPPKRKPGRPRKNAAPAPEPEPESEEEESDDEAGSPPASDDSAEVTRLRNIAIELKKKLHATGSGMDLSVSHTAEELKSEVDLLNSQINSRRGGNATQMMVVEVFAPALTKLIDRFVPDKDSLDVSSKFTLKDEIKNNWDIFDEAVTQIAINHSSWFAVNPYMSVVQSLGACVRSVNDKNQKAKIGGVTPENKK